MVDFREVSDDQLSLELQVSRVLLEFAATATGAVDDKTAKHFALTSFSVVPIPLNYFQCLTVLPAYLSMVQCSDKAKTCKFLKLSNFEISLICLHSCQKNNCRQTELTHHAQLPRRNSPPVSDQHSALQQAKAGMGKKRTADRPTPTGRPKSGLNFADPVRVLPTNFTK